MKAIDRFFKNIIYSFTKADFYKKVLAAPFSFTLKYFLFLCFLISIVYSIILIVFLVPATNMLISQREKIVNITIPSGLEVKIQNGKVSTNAKEPVVISYPELQIPNVKNILVIDTKTPFSEEQYNKYQTLVWLTQTSLVYPDRSDYSVKITSLKEVKNVVINRGNVNAFLDKAIPVIKNVLWGLMVFLLPLIFVFLTGYKLLSMLFIALAIYVLAKLAKYNFTFSKSYQLGLHASTLPFIIQYFMPFIDIPLWYLLLTLIILFYLLRKGETSQP